MRRLAAVITSLLLSGCAATAPPEWEPPKRVCHIPVIVDGHYKKCISRGEIDRELGPVLWPRN